MNNQGLDEAVLYYISYMYNKETISVNSYKDELVLVLLDHTDKDTIYVAETAEMPFGGRAPCRP